MRRALFLLLALALAACSQPEDASGTEPVAKVTSSTGEGIERPAFPAPESLVGEYRVAGVDGAAVDLGWAMTVSIDDTTIRLMSQCVTPEWTYHWDGKALQTESIPIPICERGLAPAEEAAIAAFDAAIRAGRTPENAIELTGGGHIVTLFSQ